MPDFLYLSSILFLSMGLFGKQTRSAALIDIGSASVGGALVIAREGEPLRMCYSLREDVRPEAEETDTDAMLRTLAYVTERMHTEGLPQLGRLSGSRHLHHVVTSVAGPWQETTVRQIVVQDPHGFTFTRAVMEKAVRQTNPLPGRIISDTSVIATVLNGYHTESPYGKHVTKAELTVLTSTLDKFAAREITRTVKHAFPGHTIELTAFAPVSFAVIADLYPLQKDFVVIDVSGTATDAMIVKQGIIAGVRSIPTGIHTLMQAGRKAVPVATGRTMIDPARNHAFAPRVAEAEEHWLTELESLLSAFAEEHPLPRTVFLLADTHARDFLKRFIDGSRLRTLWLSGDSLSVIAFAPEHTARLVQARGLADSDVFLAMLGIFYRDRLSGLKK